MRLSVLFPLFMAGTLLLAGCLLAGCSKSNHPAKDPYHLVGDWRLTDYGGGFAGISVHVPADSVVILSLHDDGTYMQLVNLRVQSNGTYKVRYVSNGGPGPDSAWAILLDGANPLAYELRSDTLSLAMMVYDGFGYVYKRRR